jgi:hypothetical protein
MIIRAVSVFEGIVYHSYAVDRSNPCRPVLEVEAVVRAGDVDAGPLLVSVAEWAAMAGGPELVRPCLPKLRDAGRIVDHLGAPYLSFPFWTPVELEHR